MARRLVLCVYLLSLLSVCISDLGCELVNERNWLIRSGNVSRVGTYRRWGLVNYHRNIPTFYCLIHVSGNREGITRRIQIYDYDTYVGACSGSLTISKGPFDEKFTLQLCGSKKPQSYQDNWDYLKITVPILSNVNLTVEDVFVKGKPVLGNEVELPVDAAWKALTSFGYPNGYPSFLDFTYILKSENSRKIELSVLDLDMDGYNSSLHCEHDYIDIGGAETKHRWCQGSHSLTSQGPILNITVRTDAMGSARGFQLRYRESPTLPSDSSTLAPTWTTPRRWVYFTLIATEQPQTLSQSVKQIFDNYVDYRWIIENFKRSASRIKVAFTNVNLGEEMNCSQANVTLYEGTVDDSNELDILCGRVTPGVSFTWLSPLTIRLQTHGVAPAQFREFVLEYQSTAANEVDSCNTTVQVYSNATYLTFASRGRGPADSMECWWKLLAPSGSRVSLQSEDLNLPGPGPRGCSDWLQVYNGLSPNAAPLSEKVCGWTPVVVASTAETMLVRFHTDSYAFSSFRLRVQTYESLPPPDPSKETSIDDLTSPMPVIWSTVVCLFGLVVITVLTVCCCYQCRKRKKRSRRLVRTGNSVTLQSTSESHAAMEMSDLERQLQSVSVSFISASVFWNGALSEQPPPYPGPQLETVQEDPPPSYSSLERGRDTSTHSDAPPPPPYSEM